jgi:hypothetical protein
MRLWLPLTREESLVNSTSEWISAGDALDLIESRLGGRAIAKDTLAEMLRDGKLRARAVEAWASNTNDINAIWDGRSDDTVEHDPEEEIQSDFRQSIQWADDVDSWRWPDSFFMLTVSRKPVECLYFRDVSFFKLDVEGAGVTGPFVKTAVAKGGRRTDFHRWESCWMEVIQIARDGNLVPGQISSQAALRDEILAAMGDNRLSEDSIKEPVRRVWKRFCEL